MADVTPGEQPKSAMSGLLARPQQTLHDLPVEYRWEVTRRHPYYLHFWKLASSYRKGQLSDPLEQQLGQVAVLILQLIGVTGDPPPPSLTAEDLEINQLAQAWQGGAVAPLTIRGMIGMIIKDLPPESRKYVGELLVRSAEPSADADSDDTVRKYELASELMSAQNSVLDLMPNRSILSININAPQRAIVKAVEQMVRAWKEQEEIPERRRRDDLLAQYLKVWDLREGWVDDHYDVKHEQPFGQIAQQLSLPVRTAANQYYSAFKLVCGHDYSFEKWVRLMIVDKLTTPSGNQALQRRAAVNTPRQAGSVGQVPESFMAVDEEARDGGVIAGAEQPPIDVDLIIDLQDLIKERYSDEVIIRKLDLHDTKPCRDLINYFRNRAPDFEAD